MAKYQGTAGCGHTYQVELYGPQSGRERRIEWRESPKGMCNACYAVMKRKEEAAAAIAEEAEISRLVEIREAKELYSREISRLVEIGLKKIWAEPEARVENLEKLKSYIAGGTDPSRREVCRRVLKRVEGGSNER